MMPALAEQDPIEAAHGVDEGTKLLVKIIDRRMAELVKSNSDGHAEVKGAIREQTRAHLGFAKQAGIVVAAILVFVIGGFMAYVGVNPRDAASGVRSVIAPALAEQTPAVAASPPPEE